MDRPAPTRISCRFFLWAACGTVVALETAVLPAFAAATPATVSNATIRGIYERLKTKALQKSFDLRIANEAWEGSSARVFTAWSRWLPHLNLQLSQTRSRDVSLITSGSLGNLSQFVNPQAVNLATWRVDLVVPIYQRTIHLGVLQTQAERSLDQEQYRNQLAELDWRTRALLGNAVLQFYRKATLKTSLEIARNNLREARLRFELGQRTKVDVLRSEANLVALDSKRLAYDRQRTEDINALLEYTGLVRDDLKQIGLDTLEDQPEEALFAMLDEFTSLEPLLHPLAPYLDHEPGSSTEIKRRATEHSGTYRAIRAREELSLRQAGNLMAQEWPDLSLRGSVYRQGPDWPSAFSWDNKSYSIGVWLNLPLYLGGSLFSTSSEQRHARAADTLRAEKDTARFLNEVESQQIQLRSLLVSLDSQKLNVEQNGELVRLTFRSYQLGKSTLVELLSAQDALTESKITLAKTKIDLASLARQFAWNLGVRLE